MKLAIHAKDLRKTYPGKVPVEAVCGITLEIQRGECFGLLGPNGAGKTTTMEMLEGLLDPTGGEIEILDLRWGVHDSQIRNRIGISLQETRLSDRMRVIEAVQLFRSFHTQGIEPVAALEMVSLTEKATSFVDKLSGGQLQRLAIATAIVGEPEILFLDEPTTGLDPQSRRQLWDVIRSYQAQGRTIVITTHYMDEAERLCDRVAVVDHGKIIALGHPSELIKKYGGDHIVEFHLVPSQVTSALNKQEIVDQLRTLDAVDQTRVSDNGFLMTVHQPHVAIAALLQYCDRMGYELGDLRTRQATLEDVFITLTGRQLRDEESNSGSDGKGGAD